MISKKMGRPTENPKTVSLHMRLTPDEAELLQYCANRLKTTRTKVFLRGLELIKAEIEKE